VVICLAVAIQLHFTADINLDSLTHHRSSEWQLPYSYISLQIQTWIHSLITGNPGGSCHTVTFHWRHKPGSNHSSLVICVAVAIQLYFTEDINLEPLPHHWSSAWQLP